MAPASEVRQRHQLRVAALQKATRRSQALGNVRVVLALVGLGLVLLPLFVRESWPWWLLVPLALFFAFLGRALDLRFREERAAGAAVRFYEGSLARLDETWRTLASDGSELMGPLCGPHHPAADLDLYGRASLFQLLDRAVTAEGRRALAKWLAEPADLAEVAARQAAVLELKDQVDLREQLATAAAGEDHRPVEDAALLAWATSGAPIPGKVILAVLGIVQPLLLGAAFVYWQLADEARPLTLLALLQVVTIFVARRLVGTRAEVLSGPERALTRYASLIEAIEAMKLASPRLVAIQARLKTGGEPAATRIRKLRRLVELLEWRLNAFFGLGLGPALLWDLNLVLRTERWREETGPALPGWLLAIGELEALASFAAFAYERPDYGMPSLVAGPPSYSAQQLAHPLIDRKRVVANDLSLDGPGSVLLLSGSNMSGKSTLLRSVGLSVVMARAGAPVAAKALSLSDFELMTSVRLVDSLAAGTSHFYAEILRLKAIVDRAADARPVLYLLDEVLHGTNSKERYLGAMAVIRWLAGTGAMGIVTTHDLALAEIATQLPTGKARNLHFSDDVQSKELRFDYRLREGPIQSTNALRLMRAVGIDLDFEAEKPR